MSRLLEDIFCSNAPYFKKSLKNSFKEIIQESFLKKIKFEFFHEYSKGHGFLYFFWNY